MNMMTVLTRKSKNAIQRMSFLRDRSTSLYAGACIRVVLLPVGDLDESLFHEYANRLNEYHTISMLQVSPYDSSETVFKHLSWQKGFLRMNFVLGPEAHDTLELGWQGIQAHKRSLAVIGICHCPSTKNLFEAFTAFREALDLYPTATVSRCCCFDMTEDILARQDHLEVMLSQGLEVFHPDRMLDDGRSSVDFRMEMMITNVCTDLMQYFEKIIKEGQEVSSRTESSSSSISITSSSSKSQIVSRTMPSLNSHIDMLMNGITYPGDDVAKLKPTETKRRKRQFGRVQTWLGYHCLFAGTPEDAFRFFGPAITACKASGDAVWHAIALEGSACARFIREHNKMLEEVWSRDGNEPRLESFNNDGVISPRSATSAVQALEQNDLLMKLDQDIVNELKGALALYSVMEAPRFLVLEAESTLKLARYYAICKPKLGAEALHVLTEFMERADEVTRDELKERQQSESGASSVNTNSGRNKTRFFTLRDKLDFSLEAALICDSMGFHRKFSLFVQQSASICCELSPDWRLAYDLTELAASRHGIFPKCSKSYEHLIVHSQRRAKNLFQSWNSIRRVMLESLIMLSRRAKRLDLTLDYSFQLLEMSTTEADQFRLKNEIEATIQGKRHVTEFRVAPSFPSVMPCRQEGVKIHGKRYQPPDQRGARPEMDEKSTFLYSPFQEEHGDQTKSPSRLSGKQFTQSPGSTDAGTPSSTVAPIFGFGRKRNTVKWVQAEQAEFSVLLSNPLLFDIQVSAISLVVAENEQGERCICYPRSFRLPAKSHKLQCTLAAKPIQSPENTEITILGCEITIFGVSSKHMFPRPVKIEVVSPMPLLSSREITPKPDSSMALFNGESFPLRILLENTGPVEANEISISATVSFDPSQSETGDPEGGGSAMARVNRQSLLRYNGETCDGILPGLEKLIIPSSQQRTPYSWQNEQENFMLSSTAELWNNFHSGMHDLGDENRKHRQVIDKVVSHSLDKYEMRSVKPGETILIPLIVTARFGCRQLAIQITYGNNSFPSCNDKSVYYQRKFQVRLEIDVKLALRVLHFDIKQHTPSRNTAGVEISDTPTCYAIVDVANASRAHAFQLSVNSRDEADKDSLYEGVAHASSIRRLVFQLPRCEENRLHDNIDLLHWVEEKVKISWNCEPLGRIGSISLLPSSEGLEQKDKGVTSSSPQTSNTAMGELPFSIAPGAYQRAMISTLQFEYEFKASSDEEHRLDVKIRNVSISETFENLDVSLTPKHSYGGNETEMFLWTGALDFTIETLKPGESREHNVWLVLTGPPEEKSQIGFQLLARENESDSSNTRRIWRMENTISL